MLGITVPLSTHTYNDNTMQRVTGAPRPGDLLWRHDSQVQHLQIYIGNNEIVEAQNERTGVVRGRYGGWMRHTAIWRPKNMNFNITH
jgi:cell wall-associated NlpC family hydrolase